MLKKSFPFFKQPDSKDCGPTCLKIIAKHYGKTLNIQNLRQLSETTREGSNLLSLSEAAEQIGFRTLGVKLSLEKLTEAPLPCILHWNNNHYVVLYKVKGNRKWVKGKNSPSSITHYPSTYSISDPAHGLIEYNQEDFLKCWIGNNSDPTTEEGIALLLETTPKFYQETFEKEENKSFGFQFLFQYVFKYKSFLIQLAIGLLAGSLLQLIFPFLTQSVVDVGIQNQNIHFIYLVLIALLIVGFHLRVF